MRRGSFWVTLLCSLIISIEAFGLGVWIGGADVSASSAPASDQKFAVQLAGLQKAEAAQEEAEARASELEAEMAFLKSEVEWMRDRMGEGYLHLRKVVVDETYKAVSLIEPKLMLSVKTLSGREVVTTFGNFTHSFSVGERFDFAFEDCNCFLLLAESERDRAVFNLGCEQSDA